MVTPRNAPCDLESTIPSRTGAHNGLPQDEPEWGEHHRQRNA